MKTKTIPFDLETAKKIQAGEVEGRIVTKDGRPVRLICYDAENEYPLVCLVKGILYEGVHSYHLDGRYKYATSDLDLVIEFPEEAPKHEFKPFDKVLVRMTVNDTWCCDFFSHMNGDTYVCICDAFTFCIPYEGNQDLVGTTKMPKDYGDK